jgi:two-component system nitrate/nitrite sensor histidine kinase NarX
MDDRELLRARLATFAALFLVFGFYLSTAAPWILIVSGVIALFTAALLTAVLEFWLRLSLRRASSGQQIIDVSKQIELEQTRLQVTVLALGRFLQAHSEKEILETVMQTGMQLFSFGGSSFVPYDEWGQSLPALMLGKVPGTVLQSWAQRLSLPETRQVCKSCQVYHGEAGCVLLSLEVASPSQVHCFPIKSGGREAGVLNFFHDPGAAPDEATVKIFREIIQSAGQALENLRSRDQEIAALLYLQRIPSPQSDLSILLNSLLQNVQDALDVDFALLYLPGGIPGKPNSAPQLFSCRRSEGGSKNFVPDMPFLEGIWKSVISSGQSLSLENVVLNKMEKLKALFAVPLTWRGEDPVGVLVLGSNSSQGFAQRHQALLETLAGQAALLIQNSQLMVQVEYQAVLDERTRLAREIHDGLAQTLAFLKIQAAQMQNYLSRGDTEKLKDSLQASYRTLSDAYIDARQAIENLRRVPTSELRDWIGQVASDYELATNQKVSVNIPVFTVEYPANVQAQLIRIVQEALSNIRKHANAEKVEIIGTFDGDLILIKIQDDGYGFSPESVKGRSRYGLRGMRERAESIGADFQITSQPGQGTIVSLRMPVIVKEQT